MPGRFLVGVVLLVLGLGFLIDQFYPGLNLVGKYWPALLILWGLNDLVRNPRRLVWPLLLMVIGVLVLMRTLNQQFVNPWVVIAAALLIGIGLRLLLPRRERRMSWMGGPNVLRAEDRINQSVSFGGAKMRVTSQQFRGGRVTVAFGGAEIDLRDANLAPEGADLVLEATFGGIEVRIPEGWPVVVSGTPVFGACESHLRNSEFVTPGGAALRITCNGVFSGIELKN